MIGTFKTKMRSIYVFTYAEKNVWMEKQQNSNNNDNMEGSGKSLIFN